MSYSPRKVPLNSGVDTATSSGQSTTRHAFFCGVVVEGGDKGQPPNQDVQDLVSSLGEALSSEGSSNTTMGMTRSSSAPSMPSSMNLAAMATGNGRQRSRSDGSALMDVIKELVTTERSYVSRLKVLKESYGDPLRSFARSRDTAIIPPYEAKTLFGNIDTILAANESFLLDLEKMMAPNGPKTVGGVGDVTLKHFRDLKAFDCYKQYYSKREEAHSIFERELAKKQGFANFIERIKYSTSDVRSRVGLRELLMDPVQRIPRYTMMFRSMIDHMSPADPQKAKLIEADQLASKIALCEADDPTKRAAIMYCLERTIDGFPPGLVSNGRRFVDCIDVEDIPVEGLQSSSSSGSNSLSSSTSGVSSHLHCTLFLFDDRLMIVKRQAAGTSGRAVTGLNDLDKLMAKMAGAGGASGKGKGGLSCKGVVDVLDLVASNPGGSDIHLYLEKPPQDQTDRWSGRPFRSLSVVHPPAPINFDPTHTQADKMRFLNNLWTAQANYRTRQSRSVVVCMPDREVETKSGRLTIARTYFNVYHRTAYLGEPRKGKVVIHIDPSGEADVIPFGVDTGPYVIVRVHPMPGELCRYKVSSRDPNDPGEEDIVSSVDVPSRIIQTIHQYRLFKFRTGIDSAPATPTHSSTVRSRTAVFGLEAVSRNLFNGRPGSVMGDVFGTISSSHKRTRSAASRASTQTTTTNSSFRFSSRSASTAPTSIMEDDDSYMSRRSPSPQKVLKKRARSPVSGSESEQKTNPAKRKAVHIEESDRQAMDESEWNLSLRLELARNNSQKQEHVPTSISDESWEAISLPGHSSRLAPKEPEPSLRTTTSDPDSRPTSTTPTQTSFKPKPLQPTTQAHRDRRPLKGPRTPVNSPPRAVTPLPTETEGIVAKSLVEVQALDLENLLADMTSGKTSNTTTNAELRTPPRPRMPLQATNVNFDSALLPPLPAPPSVEPLSIKKKSSVQKGSTSAQRKQSLDSPSRAVRSGSQHARSPRHSSRIKVDRPGKTEEPSQLLIIAETTREDMDSSRRAVKRLKLEVDSLKVNVGKQLSQKDKPDLLHESGLPRSPQSRHIANKAAEERMLEMRMLIGQGRGAVPKPPLEQSKPSVDVSYLEEWSKTVEGLVTETDATLKKAAAQHEDLQAKLKVLVADAREKSADLNRAKAEIEHVKKQCEVVKKFLDDATTEKEIMYDAFNEELDGMYNDVTLPETEAWEAMTKDLRKTKDARNALQMENTKLKRELEESRVQNEHWQGLLRKAGLL